MNLNALYAGNGNTAGFKVRSMRHTDRVYLVETKASNGKFVLSKIGGTHSDIWFVAGDLDRYTLFTGTTVPRVTELRATIAELESQAEVLQEQMDGIDVKIGEMEGELETLGESF